MTAFADMERVSAVLRRHTFKRDGIPNYYLWFWCPGCDEPHAFDNGWTFDGNYDQPTFSPSLLCWNDPNPKAKPGKFRDGWRCHLFIRDGQIQFLSDCTHALAGQTVSIPPFPDD